MRVSRGVVSLHRGLQARTLLGCVPRTLQVARLRLGGRRNLEHGPRLMASALDVPRETQQPSGAAACASRHDMLAQKRWVVVGRGTNDVVPRLVAHLTEHGRQALLVDPYGKSGPEVPRSLEELPVEETVDVVDFCCNPSAFGKAIIAQCAARGIHNVFIQPGAGNAELEDDCKAAGIAFHHGCVLLEI